MNIHCQRCLPEEGVLADMKVTERNADTGAVIRYWYVCAVHLEEDFGPWLKAQKQR